MPLPKGDAEIKQLVVMLMPSFMQGDGFEITSSLPFPRLGLGRKSVRIVSDDGSKEATLEIASTK
jgi:hypothetical protein